MLDDDHSIQDLRDQIAKHRYQLDRLEAKLADATARLSCEESMSRVEAEHPASGEDRRWPLSLDEYKRYGRQMILPTIGIDGRTT